MIAQLCQYAKNHEIEYFKCISVMEYKFYLNKAVFKKGGGKMVSIIIITIGLQNDLLYDYFIINIPAYTKIYVTIIVPLLLSMEIFTEYNLPSLPPCSYLLQSVADLLSIHMTLVTCNFLMLETGH